MEKHSLLVRITSPVEDKEASGMYHEFMTRGHCNFERGRIPMGVLLDAREEGTSYVLTVEITNPVAIQYIRSLRPTTP